MVMPFGLPRPLDAIGTVAAIGTGIVSTTIHDAVDTVETVAAVGTEIVSTTVHDAVDAVETVAAIGTGIVSTTVHGAVDLGARLATLPYMGKRNLPTTYHGALEYSVEGYKQMRYLLDWFFDIAEFQPSSGPVNTVGNLVTTAVNEANLAIKRVRYAWAHNGDFPPHLLIVPIGQFAHESIHLFKFTRLFDTIKTLFPFIPDFDFFKAMAPPSFANMQYLFARNKILHYIPFKPLGGNMYTAENVGLREDWFTDAVFAQQQFTGVNPCTITVASQSWIQAFTQAARDQGNHSAAKLLASSTNKFYVQDCSYFREAAGMTPTEAIYSNDKGSHRYGCASVSLFHLLPTGKLHPIAIILDWKGSIDSNVSVTIFNRRLSPSLVPAVSTLEEASDWPWRYAKMCAQASDWVRHEVGVHLTLTHLVEEAIIVAAQRSLPDGHIVHTLLSPHWLRTLSLNSMARMILVPDMIAALAPFKLPEIKALCNYTYQSFDFTGHYIPEDLKKRGFDVAHFDNPFGQFHNYAYARDMAKMWDVLHKFVDSALSAHYKGSDAEVRADKYVADFCAEMQSTVGGQMPQFPTVKTLADLVDVVTMCIHIASPQHTSINYLQQYYLTYVPNRPSALFAPLPTSLKELAAYKEADVLKALPLQSRNTWLMMAQVPYLLSAEVEPENNIVSYAKNAAKSWNSAINQAAKVLQEDVKGLEASFKAISAQMDDQGTEYAVLDPNIMATSILI